MLRGMCFPILSSFPSAQGACSVCDSLKVFIGTAGYMCRLHMRIYDEEERSALRREWAWHSKRKLLTQATWQ